MTSSAESRRAGPQDLDAFTTLARTLLAACEVWARRAGCTEFASDCELTNTVSQAFHHALGFIEANRIVCYTKQL